MPDSFHLDPSRPCKHAWKDLEEDTPHDPRQADVFIYFAGRCYRAGAFAAAVRARRRLHIHRNARAGSHEVVVTFAM
jgi:hypothetical protein